MMLEEAARISPSTFYEVMVPLLTVANTTLLGITTPMEVTNFYNQLMELTNSDGSPMFRRLIIHRTCAACAVGPHPEQCMHRMNEAPAWKTVDAMEKVQRIMKTQPELATREIAGMAVKPIATGFDPIYIRRFETAPAYPPSAVALRHFFVSFDPSGGGHNSEAAITCGYFVPHAGIIVVSVCAYVCVCVSAHPCVRVCVCARARARVRAGSRIH